MIILPLIERELRSRARGRALYWTRFAVALAGLLFCLPMATVSAVLPGGSRMVGHSVFMGIVMAAFVLSCCAGFVTVDRISRERREGTLGLLWLTRVKEPDVLLGSFGAAGITCLCALTAFLPVVMLPVLTGGVTGGEAFRMMLVLLDTLLLSLAAGLWASAGARGRVQSARALVLVLLFIIVAPVFLLGVSSLACVSPLAALEMANDASYLRSAGSFWMSLAALIVMSWLFLIAAGFRLRRAMREGDGMAESRLAAGRKAAVSSRPLADANDPANWRGFTLIAWKVGCPEGPDLVDPVRWLVRRQGGMKAAIWMGALIGVLRIFGLQLMLGFGVGSMSYYSRQPIYLALSFVQACLFGWAASRFFLEGRQSGELELALTTPVGARTIVTSQWMELKKLFTWPVIVLVASNLALLGSTFGQLAMRGSYPSSLYLYSQVIFGVNIVIGAGALIWAGLWFGLKARSQAAAIIQIVLLSQAVPYLVSVVGNFLLGLLFNALVSQLYGVRQYNIHYLSFWMSMLPQFAILFYYLWLIRWARRRLAGELKDALPVAASGARAGLASAVGRARSWPPAPER
jgi:hypothetical protein